MKNNIILVGFMGSGKTTVGKILAGLLNYTFIDSDAEIERLEGKTISDIFAQNGEAYFRQRETEALKELCKGIGLVVSTGGGAVLKEENIELLKQNGYTVYLKVTPKTVIERLKNDTTRPLLARPDRDTIITELIKQREPFYISASELSVNAEDTPEMIAQNILSLYSDKV